MERGEEFHRGLYGSNSYIMFQFFWQDIINYVSIKYLKII
jgi:hypothetical protein